jgi:hypothetical protein
MHHRKGERQICLTNKNPNNNKHCKQASLPTSIFHEPATERLSTEATKQRRGRSLPLNQTQTQCSLAFDVMMYDSKAIDPSNLRSTS